MPPGASRTRTAPSTCRCLSPLLAPHFRKLWSWARITRITSPCQSSELPSRRSFIQPECSGRSLSGTPIKSMVTAWLRGTWKYFKKKLGTTWQYNSQETATKIFCEGSEFSGGGCCPGSWNARNAGHSIIPALRQLLPQGQRGFRVEVRPDHHELRQRDGGRFLRGPLLGSTFHA